MTKDQFLAARARMHFEKTVGVTKCPPTLIVDRLTAKPASHSGRNWKSSRILREIEKPVGLHSSISRDRRLIR